MAISVDEEKITCLKCLLREAINSIKELQKYKQFGNFDAMSASREADKVVSKINSELGEGLRGNSFGLGIIFGLILTIVGIFLYFKFVG